VVCQVVGLMARPSDSATNRQTNVPKTAAAVTVTTSSPLGELKSVGRIGNSSANPLMLSRCGTSAAFNSGVNSFLLRSHQSAAHDSTSAGLPYEQPPWLEANRSH
jgi:hypothetical protein